MSDAVDKDMDTEYTADLARILYEHTLNQQFTDFRIHAGSNTVYCHQVIVSAKSEYFHSICASGMTEAILEHAKEEDGQILTSVLKFLYLGKTNITAQNVESLVLAAEFIKHSELKRQCEEVMIANLTVRNVLRYHALARKEGLSMLNDRCTRIGREKFTEVSHTDWFLSLSVDELEQYLHDDDLNVPTEDRVIGAVQRWFLASQATPSAKEDYLDVLFHCIRLPYCNRSNLEVISMDPNYMDKFRLKILEYLRHGLYGDRTPRKFYSASHRSYPHGTSAKSATPTSAALSGEERGRVSGDTGKSAGSSAPPRASTTDAAAHEKLLILGGVQSNNSHHTDIIVLGDSNTRDATIAQAPSSVDFSVCATSDSLIVSGGQNVESRGNSIPNVKQFSLSAMEWTDLADMPEPVSCHGSACVDEHLYTIGGSHVENHRGKCVSSVKSLDLTSNTWSPCKNIHEEISSPGIVVVEKDILAVGGWNGVEWTQEIYKFQNRWLTWSRCSPVPCPISGAPSSAAAVNKMVFVLCGSGFAQYNVAVDEWSVLPLPPKPSYRCPLVLKQGKLLALGGSEFSSPPHDRIRTYDVASRTWKLEKKLMPVALHSHWAFVLPDHNAQGLTVTPRHERTE